MAVIQVNLSDEALEILEESAAKKDISVSEFIRRATLSKLEDEDDLREAEKAYKEFLEDGEFIPHEEFWKELDAS